MRKGRYIKSRGVCAILVLSKFKAAIKRGKPHVRWGKMNKLAIITILFQLATFISNEELKLFQKK